MKSFRNVLGIVCLGVILIGGASLGRAQEKAKEEAREEVGKQERLRDRERILENEGKILEKYAGRYGVDIDILADLRAQRLGYGEISHALVLSEMTGKSLDEIVAMRQADKGWGQIADELGVNLGKVTKEVKREHRRIRSELTAEERRALSRSWQERRAKEVGPPQPRYEEEKPGKEYAPPERGREKGGGHGRGR